MTKYNKNNIDMDFNQFSSVHQSQFSNIQQELQERIQKRLETELYPTQKLSKRWRSAVNAALYSTSVDSLAIDPLDWPKIVQWEGGPLSLHHFACLSNNLQCKTPTELGMTLKEYADLMVEADGYITVWQEKMKAIQHDESAKLSEENKLKSTMMKGIKAEA